MICVREGFGWPEKKPTTEADQVVVVHSHIALQSSNISSFMATLSLAIPRET